MPKLICLMYHALYETSEDFNELLKEEQPYAVSTQRFNQQLEFIKRLQIQILDPVSLLKPGFKLKENSVLLTFDDGHKSFHNYALPLLQQHQAKAVFFITTDLMDTRNDFCSWQELSQLKEAGMMIGAHGKTHAFLSDLNEPESRIELRESKHRLDQKLHQDTRIMSFPGGRYTKRDLKLAKDLGYTCLMTSDIGKVSSPIGISQISCMPRIAIRHDTSDQEFHKMITAKKTYINRQKLIQTAKRSLKTIIGNKMYHSLYQRFKN